MITIKDDPRNIPEHDDDYFWTVDPNNNSTRLQEKFTEKRTFEEPYLLPTCINVMYAHIDMLWVSC
jgi:hypothetical protein